MHPIRSILVLAALTLAPTAVHSATATDAALAEKTASAYRRSAEQGDADAALRLGNMVSRNTVPAEKFGTASDWYVKGCALGSLSACHNAGVAYQFGRNGVKRDYYEAAKYYLKAADRAFLPSQINLVVLYANGQVISQDHREGLKWMLIAQKSAMQCVDNPACCSILDDKSAIASRWKHSCRSANNMKPAKWQMPGGRSVDRTAQDDFLRHSAPNFSVLRSM